MDTADSLPISTSRTPVDRRAGSIRFQVALLLVVGLGLFFRLSGLGIKIYSHDEVFTSLRAAGHLSFEVIGDLWNGKDRSTGELQQYLRPGTDKSVLDTISSTALYGPHQAPLFFVIMHYWMRWIGDTPAAMRGLAALFSLMAIPAIYLLGWELFRSARTALLAAALFALSPFHILFAQDARPYSLWTLAILLSSTALLQALRRNDRAGWLLYSLTLILGVYSHQLFLLVLLVHGCYMAVLYFIRHHMDFGGFLAACLAAFLVYLPWLFFVITRWQYVLSKMSWVNSQVSWSYYIQRWVLILSSPLFDMDLRSGNLISYALRGAVLVFLVIALYFFVRHSARQQWMLILLLYIVTTGAFIVPDLLLGGMRSTNGRYFIPANIATLLVVAYVLKSALDRADGRVHLAAQFLFVLLVAGGIVSNVNSLYAETWWNKELSRMPAGLAHEIDRDGTLLIVTGSRSTNLGDVLSLSAALDADVRFRMYGDSADLEYSEAYETVYWYPSTYENVKELSQAHGLQVREVFQGTVWQILGTEAESASP